MISVAMGGVIVLAQAALGWGGHHAPKAGACVDCGAGRAGIYEQITILQSCPNWRKRDNAAHALRKVDWRCHPEVVDALAYAMLRDCEEEVREEAAETLAKLAPCTPTAHLALTQAANCDRDHATRKWARRALKAMDGRCEAPCQVCGVEAVPAADYAAVVPGPVPVPGPGPVPFEPKLAPGEILVPEGSDVYPLPQGGPGVAPPADVPALEPLSDGPGEVKLLQPTSFTVRRPNFAGFLLPRTPAPGR